MDYLFKKKNYEQKIFFSHPLKFFPRLETWAKPPPLKKYGINGYSKFVILYNNYFICIKISRINHNNFSLIFDKGVGVDHFTDSDFTDR